MRRNPGCISLPWQPPHQSPRQRRLARGLLRMPQPPQLRARVQAQPPVLLWAVLQTRTLSPRRGLRWLPGRAALPQGHQVHGGRALCAVPARRLRQLSKCLGQRSGTRIAREGRRGGWPVQAGRACVDETAFKTLTGGEPVLKYRPRPIDCPR
jgi:hypothetical protein